MVILPILDHFWSHFGNPGIKILGNQFSEVSRNGRNQLRGYENMVLGTEMSTLAQMVWIIWSFYPFWSHFGSPGTNILGNQLSEVSESTRNELSWYENRVVGREMSILALLVWIIW